jgi:NADP-dependent 3-hydroxy acid dehydrogenase YdfG
MEARFVHCQVNQPWRNTNRDEVLNMSNNISGKVVVITGASSGLGEATARPAWLSAGRPPQDKLDALVTELTNAGGQAIAYQTDVTSGKKSKRSFKVPWTPTGALMLVNNAGLMAIAPLSDARTDEWDRMIDINIKGCCTESRLHCWSSRNKTVATSSTSHRLQA